MIIRNKNTDIFCNIKIFDEEFEKVLRFSSFSFKYEVLKGVLIIVKF